LEKGALVVLFLGTEEQIEDITLVDLFVVAPWLLHGSSTDNRQTPSRSAHTARKYPKIGNLLYIVSLSTSTMTAADILRITTTVGTVQLLCDLISNWRIYGKEPYQRALGALSRQKWKRDKILADSKAEASAVVKSDVKETSSGGKKGSSKVDKHAKRLQRAEDDYLEAASEVARRHTLPGVLISVLFIILLRILGAEYSGQMIGILPFAPFSFLQRFFGRGLEFGELAFESMSPKVTETSQACSFVFVYSKFDRFSCFVLRIALPEAFPGAIRL
jgi:hypothetical protein